MQRLARWFTSRNGASAHRLSLFSLQSLHSVAVALFSAYSVSGVVDDLIAFVCFLLSASRFHDEGRMWRRSHRKPTAPVSVTVSYKGQPVEGALVQFVIVDNPSVGITDASGKCSLKTYEAGDGAILGTNVVTITKTVVVTKNVRKVKPEDADLIELCLHPSQDLIPPKYASQQPLA